MKYVNPNVEYWFQGVDRAAHVARCARVCYASARDVENEKLVERLERAGHMSMFRHESRYYIVRDLKDKNLKWLIHFLQHSDYASCYVVKKATAYISTNGQFVREHQKVFDEYLADCEHTEPDFISEARKSGSKAVQMLIRHTVCVTTQIGTSRELNRTSPNNIAEQSTRYVNFGKRGGITICRPWWLERRKFRQSWAWDGLEGFKTDFKLPKHHRLTSLLMRIGWHIDDLIYRLLIRLGVKPQDARGKLPLDAATRVVYTYNGFEWRHIFDLRLRQTTGKAHPNAVRIAGPIRRTILSALEMVDDIKGLQI